MTTARSPALRLAVVGCDAVMAAFVAGLSDGTPFETDRLDNLETLRLMESVYQAAGVEVTP